MSRQLRISLIVVMACFLLSGCGNWFGSGKGNGQSGAGVNGTKPGNAQNNGGNVADKPGESSTGANAGQSGGAGTDPAEGNGSGNSTGGSKQAGSETDNAQHGGQADPIQDRIAGMSLQEKIGQLIIVGVDGTTFDDHARSLIEQYRVGGFILFKNNIKDVDQARTLLGALQQSNAGNKSGVPLFLGVDEEGGRVDRLPADYVKIPTALRIGNTNNTEFAYEVGASLAKQVRTVGFNLDFAPVLDINSNPKNPVIGDRAFGSKADVVRKMGVQTMKGIQSEGVIPVVKHFPGHGDTSVDSHTGLPIVQNDLDRLNKFELLPFGDAIANKADAVMVAHILLPKIDPSYPASFSHTIITDILRKQLKFTGVVMTDDMTMGAVTEHYDVGEAAVKAILAGGDIVLVCHEYERETAVLESLRQAAESGVITEERIDESVYRILQLKNKYKLTDAAATLPDLADVNAEVSGLLNKYLGAKR